MGIEAIKEKEEKYAGGLSLSFRFQYYKPRYLVAAIIICTLSWLVEPRLTDCNIRYTMTITITMIYDVEAVNDIYRHSGKMSDCGWPCRAPDDETRRGPKRGGRRPRLLVLHALHFIAAARSRSRMSRPTNRTTFERSHFFLWWTYSYIVCPIRRVESYSSRPDEAI